MTLSDLLYLCALFSVVAGVAILVAVFLGVWAAVGAGLIVVAGCLLIGSRAVAEENSS